MFEYFRGWRRKTAILALLIACLLAGLMVRSLSWSDSIYAENIHLESFRGRVFVKIFLTRFQFRFSYRSRDNRGIVDAYADPHIQSLWKWRRWGLAYEFEDSTVKFMFPIWSAVIPLALLSTWLLLSKRRPSRLSEKTVEAVQ